ncbi:MAG: hypothetical protein AAF806_33145, partial [Bacteroidota bacterium]
MKQVHITLLIFLFFSFNISLANKDSLWTIWEDESQVDTVRLDALYNFTANHFLYNDPDSAIALFKTYLDFAEAIENDKEIAFGLRLVGAAYQVSGDNEICLDYYDKSYKKSLEVGDMDGAIKSLLNKDMIYDRLGKWREVIENSEQLLPQLKANQDWGNVAILNGNLYGVYSEKGLLEEALKIALENYELIPKLDRQYHYEKVRDLARAYGEINELELAKKYNIEALAIAKELGENTSILGSIQDLLNISMNQNDTTQITDYVQEGEQIAASLEGLQSWITWKYELGDYYMTSGMHQEAETAFTMALAAAQSKNMAFLMPYLEHAIGMNALKMSNFEKAAENCGKSYDSSKNQLQSQKMTQANCNCLHKAYKALGQTEKALPYLEESYALRDSLFNEETTKATTRLTMQYEFDQEKQATDLLYQAERQRQRLIQYGLLGGLILLALLAVVIYRNYRNTAKTKQLIEAQK